MYRWDFSEHCAILLTPSISDPHQQLGGYMHVCTYVFVRTRRGHFRGLDIFWFWFCDGSG